MPLRDDLLLPIAGSNPAGVSLRYDSVTEAIKEARREDIDVAQGEWKTTLKSADWPQVIKSASEALAKRGKDLQIAVWLVEAHIRRDGFAALAPSFEFLTQLLEKFWDTLYPEIEDGDLELRAAPLDWLGTKLETPLSFLPITSSGLSFVDYRQSRTVGYEKDATNDEKQRTRQSAINEGKVTAEDFDGAVNATPREFYEALNESLRRGLQALQSLAGFCDAKFGDAAPSFNRTRDAVEKIAQQVRSFLSNKAPKSASVPAAPPPALVMAAPAPAPPVSPPVPIPSPVATPVAPPPVSAEPEGLEDAVQRVAAVCKYLRDKTIYDASAFLTIRAFRWGELRAKAPNVDPMMLEAPPPQLRSELKSNFVAGSWDEVIDATERAMSLPCGRCWLDLQRYAAQALEAKGEYYAAIGRFICSALRDVLAELPSLLDQTMTDDTPVAGLETRKWIQEKVLVSESAASPRPSTSIVEVESLPTTEVSKPSKQIETDLPVRPPQLEPDEAPPSDPLFEEALAAAQSDESMKGVQLLSAQLATERSGRARFRRRTQLAHLLMRSGHKQVALPMLQQLAAEIERRHLEDWEPGEALAYPIDLLLRCLCTNGTDAPDRQQLYARLCQLDPLRALRSQTE